MTLEQVIGDLIKTMDLVFPRGPDDEPRELGAPASAKQIATVEKKFGKPLPPSYRRFLSLHNGWTHFTGTAKILSTDDQSSAWLRERVEFWNDILDESPFDSGALPILMGDNERHFLVLDPRTVRQDGEMDFVEIDNGSEFRRFQTFEAYLAHALKVRRSLKPRTKRAKKKAPNARVK